MEQPSLKPIGDNPPSGYATTQDGFTIAYQYYSAPPNSPGIILLHMLRRDRTDWHSFAQLLQQKGYSVIAIDFRGHGQSTGNWEDFTQDDFRDMRYDIAAAKSVLESKGADVTRLGLVGASIGANAAVEYGLTDTHVKTLVLLSPGLEYRGISAEGIHLFQKPILLIASEEDSYSKDSSQILAGKNPQAELVLYQGAGHGTQMFSNPALAPTILSWLQKHV